MKRNNKEEIIPRDIEECRFKINQILKEYNCVVETDDWHSVWLRDRDTDQTLSLK